MGLMEGKVAIITGAGGGIGRGSAVLLAEHGATVVVNDVDEGLAREAAGAVRDAGGTALAITGDVRDQAVVDALVGGTQEAFGQVDVLVNNVGHYLHPPRHFLDSTEQEWDELFDLNVKTVLRCTKAVLPGMIERGAGGSIVTLTTVESLRGYPNRVVYSASKAALTGFTRSLAPLVAEHRIRVNEIAPDKTWGRQTAPGYERLLAHHEELIPWWVPLGRLGEPEDTAGAVLFLACDLSSFVTGTTLPVDGGTLAAAGWFRNADGVFVNTPNPATLPGQPQGFAPPEGS